MYGYVLNLEPRNYCLVTRLSFRGIFYFIDSATSAITAPVKGKKQRFLFLWTNRARTASFHLVSWITAASCKHLHFATW
jgi:hypothetical protein